MNSSTLRVAESDPKFVGRGIAHIDPLVVEQGLRGLDGGIRDRRQQRVGPAHLGRRLVRHGLGVRRGRRAPARPRPAARHDGGVTDRDLWPDVERVAVARVEHGVVLHVGAAADRDRVEVRAQHRAVPDRRVLLDGDVADEAGGGGDERGGVHARRLSFEREERHLGGLRDAVCRVRLAVDPVSCRRRAFGMSTVGQFGGGDAVRP